jgi:tetratricopeptide (TPR) repeat protein
MLKALPAAAAALALMIGCASSPSPMAGEWYDLGVAWQDKGDWKKAGEAYSRALALDPSLAAASFNLARALAESGDYAGSLKALDGLAKRDPGNVRVISARAYALHEIGDDKAALEAYRAVLELDPYAPDAAYNAALLELAAGDARAAADRLRPLTEAKPEDGEALALLGAALDKSGSPDGALEAYEKARALDKADAASLERIGELREGRKEYSEAMDAYAAAVKKDAKAASAWFSLARLRLSVAGDGEQGLDALKSALDSGFVDKDKAAALLDEPNLVEREKVVELLKAKGLAQ